MLMARLIDDLNNKIKTEGASFAHHYLLNKGIKVFGQRTRDALMKEMKQLHCWNCFTPISVAKMSST
jgi:RNase P subunit RPR2